ncbi:MAG: ATP-binding protein [Bdellovibrio sp.]|nr:ATP-binding protein [Bdellovibrio sp.]
MPHARARHLVSLILRKLRFSPVVALQGARQTGKSFLAREILKEKLYDYTYETLDQLAIREFAKTNPETFLKQRSQFKTFAIDEAQKAPVLFDSIKYEVDLKRIPGKYLLLGSTEFSKLALIRESLTGRMSRARLYPLNLGEVYKLPPNPSKNKLLVRDAPRITRQQFLTHLERGGMPGIFGIHSTSERESAAQDWIDLTTQRDALSFANLKIDADLCMKIFQKVALLEEPEAGQIAKTLKVDLRRINTHLHVLKSLFALHELKPHPLGTGKSRYFLCDIAFAKMLGASFERLLYTWLIQEQLSQRAYKDDRNTELYYYRSLKGSLIHLMIENQPNDILAAKLFSEEKIMSRELEILVAFKKKSAKTHKVTLCGLGADNQVHKISKNKDIINIYKWESIG